MNFRDFGSWANLVKSAAGTGLFTLPNAYASVGMYMGITGTILLGIFLTIALHILVKVHYKMCVIHKKPSLTYEELCNSIFSTGTLKDSSYARVIA